MYKSLNIWIIEILLENCIVKMDILQGNNFMLLGFFFLKKFSYTGLIFYNTLEIGLTSILHNNSIFFFI